MPATDHLADPIIVVGAGRSGTHLLATAIERNYRSHVAYVGERNEVWKQYGPPTTYDYLPASAFSDEAIARTRAAFRRLVLEHGKQRLLEKTPANTLRLPLVMRVFPDATIINIVRDGRDVALSARRKLLGDHRKVTKFDDRQPPWGERLSQLAGQGIRKLRHGWQPGVLVRNLPRYWTGALSMLGGRKQTMWGPRFPGFEAYYHTCPPLEFAAVQWRECVSSTQNFLASRPAENACEIRYEDLLAHPDQVLARVFGAIATERFPAPRRIEHAIAGGGRTWRDALEESEIRALAVHIERTLLDLGYPSSFAPLAMGST
jgi:hypothetical protein